MFLAFLPVCSPQQRQGKRHCSHGSTSAIGLEPDSDQVGPESLPVFTRILDPVHQTTDALRGGISLYGCRCPAASISVSVPSARRPLQAHRAAPTWAPAPAQAPRLSRHVARAAASEVRPPAPPWLLRQPDRQQEIAHTERLQCSARAWTSLSVLHSAVLCRVPMRSQSWHKKPSRWV